MFSIVEQRYLLELLKRERLAELPSANSKPSQFYRVMSLLEKNALITITPMTNSQRKTYKLTVFGRAMASIIAKHTKTEGYKKYAFTVEMFLT